MVLGLPIRAKGRPVQNFSWTEPSYFSLPPIPCLNLQLRVCPRNQSSEKGLGRPVQMLPVLAFWLERSPLLSQAYS